MTKNPKPKRYFNIRIDEETYKKLLKVKGKETIVSFMRNLIFGTYF